VLLQEHGEEDEEEEGHVNDMHGNCVLLSFLACFLLVNMLAYGDVGSHLFNNLCGHD